jgi:hypothetical protein
MDYTLKVGGVRYKAFEDVTLTPATFTLYETLTLTIAADRKACGLGVIVFYNMDTGSIYATTILAVSQGRGGKGGGSGFLPI